MYVLCFARLHVAYRRKETRIQNRPTDKKPTYLVLILGWISYSKKGVSCTKFQHNRYLVSKFLFPRNFRRSSLERALCYERVGSRIVLYWSGLCHCTLSKGKPNTNANCHIPGNAYCVETDSPPRACCAGPYRRALGWPGCSHRSSRWKRSSSSPRR